MNVYFSVLLQQPPSDWNLFECSVEQALQQQEFRNVRDSILTLKTVLTNLKSSLKFRKNETENIFALLSFRTSNFIMSTRVSEKNVRSSMRVTQSSFWSMTG
jgi:hypothetical protein